MSTSIISECHRETIRHDALILKRAPADLIVSALGYGKPLEDLSPEELVFVLSYTRPPSFNPPATNRKGNHYRSYRSTKTGEQTLRHRAFRTQI